MIKDKKNIEDKRYINFPIRMLKGMFLGEDTDRMNLLDNIYAYGAYNYSQSKECKAKAPENETDFDRFKRSVKYLEAGYVACRRSFENAEDIFKENEAIDAPAGISTEMFCDFRNNPNKTEFEWQCLTAYLALKSIVVKRKAYAKTNNKHWFARIDGQNKKEKDKDLVLSEGLAKYVTKYQARKIKTELENNWHLIAYSYRMRGFYISFSLPREKLVFIAESKRPENIKAKRKQEEKEARENPYKELNSNKKQKESAQPESKPSKEPSEYIYGEYFEYLRGNHKEIFDKAINEKLRSDYNTLPSLERKYFVEEFNNKYHLNYGKERKSEQGARRIASEFSNTIIKWVKTNKRIKQEKRNKGKL